MIFSNSGAASHSSDTILSLRLLEGRLGVSPKDRYRPADKIGEDGRRNEYILTHLRDVLYPERPTTPLPATVSQSQLLGGHYESGYGMMYLAEEAKTDECSGTRTILVVRRPDRASLGEIRFEPVSGDYWIAHVWDPDVKDSPGYGGGHLKFDVGGRAAALEITVSLPGRDINEGIITFDKVG
ncbi:uncharacterized protein G6M90_00g050810 [Metarhizium brunneum]|uniref:Uncharacterized protein n=1 Tax=Metarhizium brunneum TaxID=500148 RepID=A0A7D5Z6J1_9HYPO|nr:hypothetical protein G6M90_00g050810 [Metarhizium brunneum]